MSLLLDALKKAAKEKEQATASAQQDAATHGDDDTATDAEESGREREADIELSLEDEIPEQETGQRHTDPEPPQQDEEEEPRLSLEQEEVRPPSSTVSDEALQMLVYKTNNEHRRKQKLVWFGVTIASVAILLIGGLYFYSEMVKDVEALERKHRIALQKVNAEVIKRKNPELLAGLTSTPPQKAAAAAPAVERSAAIAPAAGPGPGGTPAAAARQSKPQAAGTLSMTRKQQQDPLGLLLQQGWSAYNEGRHDAASSAYQKVLQREAGNRDALLGMAAIATGRGDLDEARHYYARLLEINPRDPFAVPAMTSLQQQALDGMDETRLKLLLKQQSDAPRVNFALGNIKAGQSQWPEAQRYYFDAWRADPGSADYAFNLAISLEHIGKSGEALRFYEKSIALAATSSHRFDIDVAAARVSELKQQP